MRIAVVIPTLNPGPALEKLLHALNSQDIAIDEILIIDSASEDGSLARAQACGARVLGIPRASFNHGGTRNLGVQETRAEIVVFLTQDALPQDPHFLRALTQPIAEGRASASFARQIPYPDAWLGERFARSWNYPAEDEQRHRDQAADWGLRYVFFSNVASAVSRERFLAVQGFPERVIMNEDVVLCARLLEAGDWVFYCAQAAVMHSHNYSLVQQFRRYFDIGVFHARHADLIPSVGTGGEGLRFVRGQISFLLRRAAWQAIPYAILESAAKFLGFHLGKRHHILSPRRRQSLSMHRAYWQQPT